VLAGDAGARNHVFELERINIGRMRRIAGLEPGAARNNHIAFADDNGDVNATVSRAHAHIRLDREAGGFRLFDDGSVQGTRVLRAGRSIAVPKRGSRGVRLEHGDEIEFGAARIRFLTRWPERGEAADGGEAPRGKRAGREG
jgi:pSer/pThr/pTyr-binding forkhead associated (FHA) protein